MGVANRRAWAWGLLLFSMLAGAAPPAPEKGVHVPSAANLCPPTAPCGDHCSNVPYKKTECWTTVHGPAAADVVVSATNDPTESTNMLLCDSGPYALCFYSGPSDATGTSKNNVALPCVMNKDGTVGTCKCLYYASGTSYVDMNGILNENAYYETAQQCGHDGAKCANYKACGAAPGVSTSSCGMPEAKVCGYLRNQNKSQPEKSLIPGYDAISDFSTAAAKNYNVTSNVTACEGPYLGCMTAGCRFPDGHGPSKDGTVECECPVAKGRYQIGQVGANIACQLPPSGDKHYLWSAARTVVIGNPKAQQ